MRGIGGDWHKIAHILNEHIGFVLTEPKVYGRDKEDDEIVKILINNVSDDQELPILGMGGLGKTTLAQMVFICVSGDFYEKRLTKAIIESIEEMSLDDMDMALLQKKLQEWLNG